MHNITKHDCEQERECNASKNSGIGFFVSWNAISVNDLLEDPTELSLSEVGWTGKLTVDFASHNGTV